MSTTVTFNGSTYSIPAAGELNWSSLSSFLVDVANNAALTTGGAGITTLGTVVTGTWNATVISPTYGGTGIGGGYAVGDILYASGAATLSKLADVATGSYLASGGVTTAPAWATLASIATLSGLTTIGAVSGVSTLTFNGTSLKITPTSVNGNILNGNSGQALFVGNNTAASPATTESYILFYGSTYGAANSGRMDVNFGSAAQLNFNAGGTTIGTATNAGAWTLGAANGVQAHIVNGTTLTLSAGTFGSFVLQRSGSANLARFGIAGAANNYVTGAAAGDAIIRNDGGKILFSADGSGSVIGGSMDTNSIWNFLSTTDASSSTIAGTVIAGGLAVAKNINAGGVNHVLGTAATSFSTQVLFVKGTCTTAGSAHIYCANSDTTTSSDNTYGLAIQKGSATSTTSQYFQRFYTGNNGTNMGAITANGAGQATFTSTSDGRLKKNISDLPSGSLDKIMSLRPVSFEYHAGGSNIGFIAQEMQSVFPDHVGESADGFLNIGGWSPQMAHLVHAIQELKQEIDTMRNKKGLA